jgi:5-methylcytosine-specific restriction endonuclease McrA
MKQCSNCGITKPLSEFYKDKNKKDGISPWCINCKCAYSRKYHTENREKANERSREYYTANQERLMERSREYYASNQKRAIESTKKYAATHREEKKEYLKKYYASNREKLIEYGREHGKKYRVKHPEKARASWQRRRARQLGNGGEFTEKEWQAVKKAYGFGCVRCGRKEPDVSLERDHITPLTLGGQNVIENIQPLCRSCNASKGTRAADYRPFVWKGIDHE